MEWELYVHIPFCRQKCFYCDFPSIAGGNKYKEDYTEALCRELSAQGSVLLAEGIFNPPQSVYIGGGTPTTLEPHQLEKIFNTIKKVFFQHNPINNAVEYTIEANPGTVTEELLDIMKNGGVNRISFGVQTFNDALLKKIGRIHTAAQAVEAVRMAYDHGIQNISLDLMYGLPGQTLEDLKESVAQAADLPISHISIYGLQLEEGTAFMKMKDMGKIFLPEDELVESMYDYMTEELPKLGFYRYEVSNFSKKGYESCHNTGYWTGVPYLGAGMGAHGFWGGFRYLHVEGIQEYIDAMGNMNFQPQCISEIPGILQEEEYTEEIAMSEFAFLALRTVRGISVEAFQNTFGRNFYEIFGDAVKSMTEKDLLEIVSKEQGEYVRLTDLGMKYGNIVFEEFLL